MEQAAAIERNTAFFGFNKKRDLGTTENDAFCCLLGHVINK